MDELDDEVYEDCPYCGAITGHFPDTFAARACEIARELAAVPGADVDVAELAGELLAPMHAVSGMLWHDVTQRGAEAALIDPLPIELLDIATTSD
ncbi:MAG: hypothetical protein M0R75_16025 [Dehalococcoidia bacterium]|nr:hypothetical protein [Dehalococcoidia bacterium]